MWRSNEVDVEGNIVAESDSAKRLDPNAPIVQVGFGNRAGFATEIIVRTMSLEITRPITFGAQFDTSPAEAVVFNLKPSRAGGSR